MKPTDNYLQPNVIVHHLVIQSTQANAKQLAQIMAHVTATPFATDLLEVDEPLWGSFWHGDVIAPGYRLPAVELALLRAARLDQTWPEQTGTAQFLADLRRTIQHPRAGVWTLAVAGEPCAVFAAPSGHTVTVVWYCATTGRLHAGYRTAAKSLYFKQAVEQRGMVSHSPTTTGSTDWLKNTSSQIANTQTLAARLDAEILNLRRTGLLK